MSAASSASDTWPDAERELGREPRSETSEEKKRLKPPWLLLRWCWTCDRGCSSTPMLPMTSVCQHVSILAFWHFSNRKEASYRRCLFLDGLLALALGCLFALEFVMSEAKTEHYWTARWYSPQ